MRIHAIIHAPFEKLGIIDTWVKNNKYTLSTTHTYKGEKLPSVDAFDFLIIMGGPQSAVELDSYPYLLDEVALAKQAIDHKKVMLGICLGAQIIGACLGSKADRSPNKEVGVFPIHLTPEAKLDPIFNKLPASFEVMHWHNDMPGLPSGSQILAASEGCPRQAIRFNDRTYGLQCHMEMTNEEVRGMVEHCAADLKPGKYVQSADELRHQNMTEINQKMIQILDHLAQLVSQKETIKSNTPS